MSGELTTASPAADVVRQRFYAEKAAILADPDLNGQGKSARIAAAAEKANTEIDNLKAAAEGGVAAERSKLEQRLLALSVNANATDRMSYRDALARAEMTSTDGWGSESAELLELQRRALLVGDDLLSRACLVVAMERGDPAVVNAWEAANPRFVDDAERLWEITHQSAKGRLDPANWLAWVHVTL